MLGATHTRECVPMHVANHCCKVIMVHSCMMVRDLGVSSRRSVQAPAYMAEHGGGGARGMHRSSTECAEEYSDVSKTV